MTSFPVDDLIFSSEQGLRGQPFFIQFLTKIKILNGILKYIFWSMFSKWEFFFRTGSSEKWKSKYGTFCFSKSWDFSAEIIYEYQSYITAVVLSNWKIDTCAKDFEHHLGVASGVSVAVGVGEGVGEGGHGIGLWPRDRWRRTGRVKRTSGKSDIRLLSNKITCGKYLSDFTS